MDLRLSTITGFGTIALMTAAALVPLVVRVMLKKRAAPDSTPTRAHVMLGLAVSIVCFVHTGVALPSVGAPGAAGGGMLAMIPASIGFALLIAHGGLGLQLRNVKLKDRLKKRRMHTATAILIFIVACIHIGALLGSP